MCGALLIAHIIIGSNPWPGNSRCSQSETHEASLCAFRAATTWSALRPTSSAMWSWLKMKVPTPDVAERSSMMSEPISDFRQMRLHRVPARPALAPVKAQQLAPVPGDNLVDPRRRVARHMDLNRHDGLQQNRRALRHALGHRQARRQLERHFR